MVFCECSPVDGPGHTVRGVVCLARGTRAPRKACVSVRLWMCACVRACVGDFFCFWDWNGNTQTQARRLRVRPPCSRMNLSSVLGLITCTLRRTELLFVSVRRRFGVGVWGAAHTARCTPPTAQTKLCKVCLWPQQK